MGKSWTEDNPAKAAWRITDPLLNLWEASGAPTIPTYAAGEWGPTEADALIAADGFAWRNV